MTGVIARIDEQGPFAWIGLMVLSFILFWPAGLALLAFLIWSGRMGCRAGRWGNRDFSQWKQAWREQKRRWHEPPTSGNHAFDEYRMETIRRLEDEEREFHEFLSRLRQAKDRQEFDEFMADRRRRRESGSPGPEPAGA
ncbi:MAG TPA: DUF2852 domain-containing protein [Kiloniellales bacterium]|nr:DUF2852 domain-containing protein [Kiloniellales bacterium]